MDKMMNRMIALKHEEKVEIMNMMADKFLNNISDEEKMLLAKDLSVKLFDLMINYTSESDRMGFMSNFFTAEMAQQFASEMLPKMFEGFIKNMSEDEKQNMMRDMMPSPEDIEKQVMVVLPKLMKEQMGSIGATGMPMSPKPRMMNRSAPSARKPSLGRPPTITKRVVQKPPPSSQSPKGVGGMFKF